MKDKDRFLCGFVVFVFFVMAVSGCDNAVDQQGTGQYTSSSSATASLRAGQAIPTSSGLQVEETAVPPASSAEENIPAMEEPTSNPGIPCALSKPSDKDWPVTLCETFDDNQKGWTVESQDNPYAQYRIAVEGGKYALDYTAKGFAKFQRSALTWFDVASAGDFALSVTALMNSDFQNCSWGLAFRADKDSFFLFSIYNDSTYAFEIYEKNSWIPLISRRSFDGILTNAYNKLAVIAEGGDFIFFINDAQVNSFSGGLLQGDDIQLVVSAKEGVSANYYFDDLVMQVKP